MNDKDMLQFAAIISTYSFKRKKKMKQLSDKSFNFTAHGIVTSDAVKITHTQFRTIEINVQKASFLEYDVSGRHCVWISKFFKCFICLTCYAAENVQMKDTV